ncbi:hypothetical protein [Pseudotenacibaculum haliotis]|uniref:Uncharacterized protein n=1 Tax=Pseudotenacibaculum haliotis TaxID=1862138 RepID=A0ABW5LMM6_9FLAO
MNEQDYHVVPHVNLEPTKKDHFNLSIVGIDLGEFETSELRSIIGQIDNKI